ncbi:M16 family metallopeptidase [Bacillus sp. JJ1562]|uniref:M16 family metallopeptidase n=1 Tax=Bacillus sp. JJ1562 TaxID=3122960 RepID=UPI0030019ADF
MISVNSICLTNGLKLIIRQSNHFKSSTLSIWYGAGSITESNDNIGISHLLEHYLHRGTKTYKNPYKKLFPTLGATFNAFTTRDYTCYHSSFPSQFLEQVFLFEKDRMINSEFKTDEIEKEKEIINAEIGIYKKLRRSKVNDFINHYYYNNHPYSYPVIGTEKTIQNINIKELEEYYKVHYLNTSTVLVLSTNLEQNWVTDKFSTIFSNIKVRNMGHRLLLYKENIVGPKKIEINNQFLEIVYFAPAAEHENFNNFMHLMHLLSGINIDTFNVLNKQVTAGSLLYEFLIKRGFAKQVWTMYTPSRMKSIYKITILPIKDKASVLNEFDKLLSNIREGNIDLKFLKYVKLNSLNLLNYINASSTTDCIEFGKLYTVGGNSAVKLMGPSFNSIQLDDIQQSCVDWLSDNNRTTIL